jgi:collagenase-like PrtC family protease
MLPELAMGPVLFHWPAEKKRDFWFRVADEAPVAAAYLGEVICSKREPFLADHLGDIAERLERGGKRVVWSSLSQVVTNIDRKASTGLAGFESAMIEANDASILPALQGRPHHIGPFINVYNEATIAHLAKDGATRFSLQPELPAEAVARLTAAAAKAGATTEVQVFGRVSLALSARCYHARAHGRTKDNCLFVCENDPDGMDLETRARQKFLAVNGIQTLSHRYLELSEEIGQLTAMGVRSFRLSPHDLDMAAVAAAYQSQIEGRTSAEETAARLSELGLLQPTMNGFYHHRPGYMRIGRQHSLD